MLKPLLTGAFACVATVAGAEPTKLTGAQIAELISGASVEMDTPLGSKLPVRYTSDGRVSGQSRDLASYLGSASDTGRWWVTSDKLCHKWSQWFNSEPQCLKLKKEGRTIHWQSEDGHSGTASIVVAAPVAVAETSRSQPEGIMRLTSPATSPVAASSAQPKVLNQSTTEGQMAAAPVGDTAKPAVKVAPNPASRAVANSGPLEKPAVVLASYKVANVARDDVLNVRSGPSADFDVVGSLQPGTDGVIITGGCRSVWCPVKQAAVAGWVNKSFLTSARLDPVTASAKVQRDGLGGEQVARTAPRPAMFRDPPDAPRSCLTAPARALLERIEAKFGPVKLVSTCRPGATIAGSGRPSKHASGNAVDFNAGSRKDEIVAWLIANHHDGGTMTYPDMDHIHIDIGPHFVSIAGGEHWASWRNNGKDAPRRIGLTNAGG